MTDWKRLSIYVLIVLVIIAIVLLCVFEGPVLWKKYIQKSSSSSNDSSTNSASNATSNSATGNAANTSGTSNKSIVQNNFPFTTIKTSDGLFLDLNSNDTDDYVIVNSVVNPATSLNSQMWQKIPSTSDSSLLSFVNQSNPNLALTINGGSGSINSSTYIPNASSQLWRITNNLIQPADPIYGPPAEPKQLVLAVNTSNTSQYSQTDIAAALQGQIIPSANQADLDQASGNGSVTLNGTPLTLVALDSSYATVWTLT